MAAASFDLVIRRHGVIGGARNPFLQTVAGERAMLTDFQADLIEAPERVRIASAPTGAGKTFAFEMAPLIGMNILFIVPTRRLAQNLAAAVHGTMQGEGWDEGRIGRHLHVWTSDALFDQLGDGLSRADIRKSRVDQLRGRGGFAETGVFVIATPESVASLMLYPPVLSRGSETMSLTSLLSFDHVVFDEFHTIEARGFGLAAAICKLVAGLPYDTGNRSPRVTFLSATPIEIRPVLENFGVPACEIRPMQEQVFSWAPGEEPRGARIIHGDVRVSGGQHADVLGACQAEGEEISHALACGQSIIVVSDSVAKLKGTRDVLSQIFQRHGIEADRILTINSIDDAHEEEDDESGRWGRRCDPREAQVILATSSVEMGVTFRASLMIMDSGHDACSFVQRLGRVSRGDLPGRVIVTRARHGRVLAQLAEEAEKSLGVEARSRGDVDVGTFLGWVLSGIQGKFSRGAEDVSPNYRTMPGRAVWCAALFWCALRRVWNIHKGERDTLRTFAPKSVRRMEVLLGTLKRSELSAPRVWMQGLFREAARFRDIDARVRVSFGSRMDEIGFDQASRFVEIAKAPVLEDLDGTYLALPRSLADIFRTGETRRHDPSIDPLPPLDDVLIGAIPRRNAASTWITRTTRADHGFFEPGDEALDAMREIVRATGLVPERMAEDMPSLGGTGVL
ncbi:MULTISPECIES: DEAD/DEAH box helicase family protein [Rhodobacterales]|uniref:DEAD/DEAH box helicase family protein n=1 Tax=Rhodobacterales TaxID=204455 RepID=UPI001487039C|nr:MULTISPECIES: DEAD/DEAH box helicase family protein [Rhodobacterales]